MAAGAEGIRAGRAFVEVGADLNPLDKGLNEGKQKLKAFQVALEALGGALALSFATSKITGWVQSFAESGKEIYVMARAAGIGAAEISELKAAVGLLGGDLGETIGAMRKMGIFLNNVKEGGREATDAISQLGLSLADLTGLSETDKLQKIGEQLAKLPLNARQALGRQIFGKAGATVGIAAALGAARAETAGGGQSEAEIKAAFDLAQALGALERAQNSIFKSIGAALAPGFQAVAQAMTNGAKAAKAWVKENVELIQKIALIGSVVVGLSAGLLALATGIKLVGLAASGIAAVFGGIFAVVSSIAGVIAFAFTPFGSIVISAGILLAIFGRTSGAVAEIRKGIASLGAVFNETFQGIKNAIVSGELAAAFEIAIAGMKVVWIDFVAWAKTKWQDAFTSDVIANMVVGVRPAALTREQREARDALRALTNRANTGWIAEQDAQMQGLPDMNDLAEQLGQGSARSTFNRDVLFGFGGTPMQQLITSTKAIVDQLGPILASIDEGVWLMGAATEVS